MATAAGGVDLDLELEVLTLLTVLAATNITGNGQQDVLDHFADGSLSRAAFGFLIQRLVRQVRQRGDDVGARADHLREQARPVALLHPVQRPEEIHRCRPGLCQGIQNNGKFSA